MSAILLLALLIPSPSRSADDVALAEGQHAPLDRLIGPRERDHSGQSAFRLLSEGPEAFVVRTYSARLAVRSLDIQTFIWRADLTGKLLAYRALQAADRGVRVRLLVDDMDARDHSTAFAALAAHPNVAVRMFNPFVSRRGMLRMIAEGITDFTRVNRRMHNKAWIVDNRIAIVGGRNLGDEYFGAGDDVSFVDLDFLMFGPIVREVSASFDDYWNSPAARSIEALEAASVTAQALAALRIELEAAVATMWSSQYATSLLSDDGIRQFITGSWPMQWTGHYTFAADDPLKISAKHRDPSRARVRHVLLNAVRKTDADLMLISPYFVPGDEITSLLSDIAMSGRRVRVSTNSLVATDVSAVHGGYSRYRTALLAGGVELWELKKFARGEAPQRFRNSSAASLHTKALLIDGKHVFVGSYNLDPRSAWLNCEQGVLVQSETLARELADIFARQVSERRSWQVTLVDDRLSWSDGSETFAKDPHSSRLQRLQSWLVRVLRLEPQL